MPAMFLTTADAVDRETAWLTRTDSLPALLVDSGGRWDLVQAYKPRTPAARKNQIWVMRGQIRMARFAMIRKQPTYGFRLRCWWTLSSGQGSAEDDQRAFDAAINDVLIRINGTAPGIDAADKTHGGAFKSAAEDPGLIDVQFTDPDRTILPTADFYAEITYSADDPDFTM